MAKNIASAETMSGELENPGFDPLYWLSPPIDCAIVKAEAEKRYKKIDNPLLKSEFDAVAFDLCRLAKECKLSFCSNISLHSKISETTTLRTQEQLDISGSVVAVKVAEKMDPVIQVKADLGVLIRERNKLWKQNIERAIKNEESFKLSWQKIEMPFQVNNQQRPVINSPVQSTVGLQQQKQSQEDPVFQNSATKKNKYFDILKN